MKMPLKMAPVEIQGRVFGTQAMATAFVRETLFNVGATSDMQASHPGEYSTLVAVPGNGVLRNMLIPVYTSVGKMLQRLGSIHQQPVAAFPLI
jgi:hypothetical protein